MKNFGKSVKEIALPYFREGGEKVFKNYQNSLRANWNCRASYAAVGCPARQVEPALGSQTWFTAATLVRLKRLKLSAISRSLKRSPNGISLERRRSNWKNPGPTNRLRP